MRTLTDRSLEEATRTPGRLFLLLGAYFCGPCQEVKKMLEEHERQTGTAAAYIDVARNPNAATRYKPRTLPTLVEYEDGREVRRLTGADLKKL